jgi:hypothetical protein
VAAVALALAPGLIWAGSEIAPRPADAPSPPLPAWHNGVLVPSDGAVPAWSRRAHPPAIDAMPLLPAASWHALARGTLLRAPLNDDAQLILRLHGGKLGLYVAVRLPTR